LARDYANDFFLQTITIPKQLYKNSGRSDALMSYRIDWIQQIQAARRFMLIDFFINTTFLRLQYISNAHGELPDKLISFTPKHCSQF